MKNFKFESLKSLSSKEASMIQGGGKPADGSTDSKCDTYFAGPDAYQSDSGRYATVDKCGSAGGSGGTGGGAGGTVVG